MAAGNVCEHRTLAEMLDALNDPRTAVVMMDCGIAQHDDIELDTDESGQRATAERFTRRAPPGSMMTHPGVDCLRSNQTDWDEATLCTDFAWRNNPLISLRSLR